MKRRRPWWPTYLDPLEDVPLERRMDPLPDLPIERRWPLTGRAAVAAARAKRLANIANTDNSPSRASAHTLSNKSGN